MLVHQRVPFANHGLSWSSRPTETDLVIFPVIALEIIFRSLVRGGYLQHGPIVRTVNEITTSRRDRALESWLIREIIPFYGRKIQVGEIL